jgi:hypothetical protein
VKWRYFANYWCLIIQRMKPRTTLGAVVRFFQSCAKSRLAWLFAALHAAWFLLAIANMSPPSPALADFLDSGGSSTAAMFAGRPFHFHYEAALLQLLVLADLPSMLVQALVGLMLLPLLTNIHIGHYVGSYFGAGFLLLIATFQWLVIGRSVQTWLITRGWGAMLLRATHSLFRGRRHLHSLGHYRVRSASQQEKPEAGLSPSSNIIPNQIAKIRALTFVNRRLHSSTAKAHGGRVFEWPKSPRDTQPGQEWPTAGLREQSSSGSG